MGKKTNERIILRKTHRVFKDATPVVQTTEKASGDFIAPQVITLVNFILDMVASFLRCISRSYTPVDWKYSSALFQAVNIDMHRDVGIG